MKIAVIGSRCIQISDIKEYIPDGATEIVSGGAKGVDMCARTYAQRNGLILTEFLPEYNKFGRAAPLRRNLQIIDYADVVIAIWDGKSKGTAYVIEQCKKQNKPIKVYKVT